LKIMALSGLRYATGKKAKQEGYRGVTNLNSKKKKDRAGKNQGKEKVETKRVFMGKGGGGKHCSHNWKKRCLGTQNKMFGGLRGITW